MGCYSYVDGDVFLLLKPETIMAFKIGLFRLLHWIFDSDPLGPALIVWLYSMIWFFSVSVQPSSGTDLLLLLSRTDIGWLPGAEWSLAIVITASYQLACCLIGGIQWYIRTLVSSLTAAFVFYTVAAPVIGNWLVFGFVPVASAGSLVIAGAAALMVTRCLRKRTCRTVLE